VQVYKQTQTLPLKGFIVANGATDWDLDISPAFPDVVYNFNLIPPRLIKSYKDNNCTFYFRDVKPPSPDNKICNDLWDQINDLWQGLNWYDLFRKVYPQSAETKSVDDFNRTKTVIIGGEEKTYKVGFTFQEYTSWLNQMPMYQASQPLLGTFLSDYVNRADVRRALNIPDSVQAWSMCSGEVSENYHLQLEGSLFIYKILMQYDYKILFFSGDTDGAVPTLGTRRWIETLNMDIKNKWRQWSVDGNQVAGYIINYDGMDFATIHGAGHMAPQWKRKEVTTLFTNWIHDLPIA
jgi:carboxypeptidase C (cathepsin A)